MKRFVLLSIVCLFLAVFTCPALAQKYITLGVPTSLKLIEGYEGNRAAQLAVEEINAKGGVKVGQEKMLLKIEALDIRDVSPGCLPRKPCSVSKN